MQDYIPPADLTDLDAYYQEEFKKIHASNGTYKGKWNWWAFIFAWLWCLYKGCWIVAMLALLTFSFTFYKYQLGNGISLNLIFGSGTIWSILLGWRGTWLYYNVKVHKKQLPGL